LPSPLTSPLSPPDALPIFLSRRLPVLGRGDAGVANLGETLTLVALGVILRHRLDTSPRRADRRTSRIRAAVAGLQGDADVQAWGDRKNTPLNSPHPPISHA